MLNFSKTQVNLIVFELLLIAASATAILLKEYTEKVNVNILPEIREDAKISAPGEFALPTAKRLDEIITKTKKAKEQEITLEIVEEAPKIKLKDALKQREEKPQEFTMDLSEELTTNTTDIKK